MSQNYRVIDGKIFKQRGQYFRMSHAKENGAKFRANGCNVRIIPGKKDGVQGGVKVYKLFIQTPEMRKKNVIKVKYRGGH